jgi:folate-dependent phosphoribosylglycinamide formyltransferase PurN
MSESLKIPTIVLLASGSGSTAESIDRGPKFVQHPVEVVEGDTAQSLFDRVQVAEKTTYPYVLDKSLKEQGGYHANS